jgi:hypothetical protein
MKSDQAVLEERVAALEGGTAALAVASGHAAQVVVLQQLPRPGDEFIAARKLYGGSINQFTHAFKSFGWNVVWADPDEIELRARSDAATKAIFIESIANPAGSITDIEASWRLPARPRAADRRQHAGQSVSDPPDRPRRRYRGAFTGTSWAHGTRSAASSSMPAPSTGRRTTNIRC